MSLIMKILFPLSTPAPYTLYLYNMYFPISYSIVPLILVFVNVDNLQIISSIITILYELTSSYKDISSWMLSHGTLLNSECFFLTCGGLLRRQLNRRWNFFNDDLFATVQPSWELLFFNRVVETVIAIRKSPYFLVVLDFGTPRGYGMELLTKTTTSKILVERKDSGLHIGRKWKGQDSKRLQERKWQSFSLSWNSTREAIDGLVDSPLATGGFIIEERLVSIWISWFLMNKDI